MSAKSFGLEDKVAVVTGGGRGIGAAIVQALAEHGARIVVADITPPAAAAAATITFVKTDVTSRDSVAGLRDETLRLWHRIDILVNNAGVAHVQPIEDLDLERWENLLRVNLTGPALCTSVIVPIMKRQGWGRIVNMASLWGLRGAETYSAYAASKGALRQLTRVWAAELAASGITVNAVCPGWVKTDLLRGFIRRMADLHGLSLRDAVQRVLALVPQRRFLSPDEVAFAVCFLASPHAAGITGTDLIVDAGMSSLVPPGHFRTSPDPWPEDEIEDILTFVSGGRMP